MGICATHISINFDHIDVPCDIERVASRFMPSKNLYIHRKQLIYRLMFLGWYGICCIVSCTYIKWTTFITI
uniref:Uncharacterized protein n=1 Tax=Amphimedon queenslandica TaxID=400682 RepID=A0A1X7U0X7_AMPQE